MDVGSFFSITQGLKYPSFCKWEHQDRCHSGMLRNQWRERLVLYFDTMCQCRGSTVQLISWYRTSFGVRSRWSLYEFQSPIMADDSTTKLKVEFCQKREESDFHVCKREMSRSHDRISLTHPILHSSNESAQPTIDTQRRSNYSTNEPCLSTTPPKKVLQASINRNLDRRSQKCHSKSSPCQDV